MVHRYSGHDLYLVEGGYGCKGVHDRGRSIRSVALVRVCGSCVESGL